MGRGQRGKTWTDSDGPPAGYGGQGNAYWQLWHGARSPKASAPWRPAPKAKSAFPTYDARPLPGTSQQPGMGGPQAARDTSGLNLFQAALNSARKAEGKVNRVQNAIEKSRAQYAEFQKDLRNSYLKEKERFNPDQDRLQRELSEALKGQQQARSEVKRVALEEQQAFVAAPTTAVLEWEGLTAEWEQEIVDGNEEVFRRALAANMEAYRTPTRSSGTPGRSPLPMSRAMEPPPGLALQTAFGPFSEALAADVYPTPPANSAPSPSTLMSPLETMNLGPGPGRSHSLCRRDPSMPRLPTSVEPPRADVKQDSRPSAPVTDSSGGKPLGAKLDERRGLERSAMQPFGVPRKGVVIHEDDNDEEEMAPADPLESSAS